MNLSRKYPGLTNEVVLLTQNHYLGTLSPGIKNAVLRMISDITNKISLADQRDIQDAKD
jgi:hypothetical protein